MDISTDARVLIVSDGGGVQAYTLDVTSWVKKGTLIQDPNKSLMFNETLALSGDGEVLAVGALGPTTNRGDVQVFLWSQFQWRFEQKFEGETSSAVYGGVYQFVV